MQIDWFTFAAQIVNFLILIWLLKRFLYGPIISAMDRREKTIRGRLEAAAQKEKEAQEKADALAAEREDLEARREELIAQARAEVEEKKKEWTAQVRREVEAQENRWREAVRQQQQAFLQELRDRAAAQVIAIARRLIDDLAGEQLEQEVVRTFIRRLERLDREGRTTVAQVIGETADSELVVHSSFDIPEDDRGRIQEVLREQLGRPDVKPRYKVTSALTFGIELKAGGWKLAWSLDDYLGTMEAELRGVFEAGVHGPTSPDRHQAEVEANGEE